MSLQSAPFGQYLVGGLNSQTGQFISDGSPTDQSNVIAAENGGAQIAPFSRCFVRTGDESPTVADYIGYCMSNGDQLPLLLLSANQYQLYGDSLAQQAGQQFAITIAPFTQMTG